MNTKKILTPILSFICQVGILVAYEASKKASKLRPKLPPKAAVFGQKLLRTGVVNSRHFNDVSQLFYNVKSLKNKVIPSSLSVSIKAFDTEVKNQGHEGKCTAYALVSSLENTIARKNGIFSNLSEENAWGYYGTPNLYKAITETRGKMIGSDLYFSPIQGASHYTKFDVLDNFKDVYDSIKRGIPVILAIDVTEMGETSDGWFLSGNKVVGGHAMQVSGVVIDEKRPLNSYFEVKNSWGSSWGSNGYGKVSFGYCLKHRCAGVKVELDAVYYRNGANNLSVLK